MFFFFCFYPHLMVMVGLLMGCETGFKKIKQILEGIFYNYCPVFTIFPPNWDEKSILFYFVWFCVPFYKLWSITSGQKLVYVLIQFELWFVRKIHFKRISFILVPSIITHQLSDLHFLGFLVVFFRKIRSYFKAP